MWLHEIILQLTGLDCQQVSHPITYSAAAEIQNQQLFCSSNSSSRSTTLLLSMLCPQEVQMGNMHQLSILEELEDCNLGLECQTA
jgi:hypothetical protein